MSSASQNSLPLEGVRVVEFTHMVMGPTCGMILADLGAEVIKVEPPGGDKTRKLPGLGIGFLAALLERQRTGRGQEIQSALFEYCVFLVAQHMQQSSMTGEPPPMPSRVSAWSVYDVFTLAHGEQLFIGAVNDKHWQVLCKVLERPDLASDPALQTNEQRVHARPKLLARLGEELAHHRIEELSAKLEAVGLPYAPIVRPEQLLDDVHLKASGGLVPMDTGEGTETAVVLLPLLMGERRPGVRRPLARVGEHDDEVLGPRAGEHAA